jgi:surface protein
MMADSSSDPELEKMVGDWISNKQDALSKYGAIAKWDTSKVTAMGSLFKQASTFNEDLSLWDVSQVTDTSYMFASASAFTSDLSSWDVGRVEVMARMFSEAAKFTSDLSLWQVFLNPSDQLGVFHNSPLSVPVDKMPCWHTGKTCQLQITKTGSRSSVGPSLGGITTVYPTDKSATNTYHVGTTYRIVPLKIKVKANVTFALVEPPDGFFVNSKTGVVIATFGTNDITTTGGNGNRTGGDPLNVTLQVIADIGDRRVDVETYTMHVADSDRNYSFALVLVNRSIDEDFEQYLEDDGVVAPVVLVDTPFRVSAPRVDREKTIPSRGGIDEIKFSFKVYDAATGNSISEELDRVSIKPNGELLGEFTESEIKTYVFIITAIDGGGESFPLDPFMLHVRQRDIDVLGAGPNQQACANKGVPVDDGDPFDGIVTACDCSGIARFVGDYCENECTAGESKDPTTGRCVVLDSGTTSIIAAVAGVTVLLLLIPAVAIRYHQYKVSMRPIDFDELNRKMLENGTIVDGQFNSDRKPRELKRSSIVLLEQVGSGAFGAVWKAMLDESASTGSPEYQVAAKTVLNADASQEATEDLMTEAAVMAQLAGNKNLVSIVGVVTSGSPLIIVLSFCDHGSLLGHLKNRAAEGKAVVAAHKLDLAAQTARGMEHLCERRFIHRDLAARNVLLTSGLSASNLVCKVADFGMSRGGSGGNNDGPKREDYYKSQKGVFPVRWTAPEAMESLMFNQASDVWSFGILLIELVQDGDRPYYDLKSNGDVMALTMSGRRHQQPPGCSSVLYKVMGRCWDVDAGKRPIFAELAPELEQLHAHATRQSSINRGRCADGVAVAEYEYGNADDVAVAEYEYAQEEFDAQQQMPTPDSSFAAGTGSSDHGSDEDEFGFPSD